jgi:hypothetical protein
MTDEEQQLMAVLLRADLDRIMFDIVDLKVR